MLSDQWHILIGGSVFYQAFNVSALESFLNINAKPKKRKRLFNDVLLIARGARESLNGRQKDTDNPSH